jgi:hypothetical protein
MIGGKMTLAPEYEIACTIFDYNKNNIPVCFSMIAKDLDGLMNKNTISSYFDVLEDMGFIEMKWKVIDEYMTATYEITEDAKILVEYYYDRNIIFKNR